MRSSDYEKKLQALLDAPGKKRGAIRKLMIEYGKLEADCGCMDAVDALIAEKTK